eukprot:gnl/MRDRNA2_/MRDRNA2_204957_c0_seq1.p1 gnl/MRDRNA2_/MRDRNA2_204957_c0~~gnl/MRDRNA2_/MRDRNA2_204957_c0_seq1.p1  ORF type:complete len:288 (+),score=42.71 gnl/MRDRNA2_/MRDRNA2_204957_c0_seq1:65-928(+)
MGNLCTQPRLKHLEVGQLEIGVGCATTEWVEHCWPLVREHLAQKQLLSDTQIDDLCYLRHPYNRKVYYLMPTVALAERNQANMTENWWVALRKFLSGHAKYVMKFESCEQTHAMPRTELENLHYLAGREDGIAHDPRLVFPEFAFKVIEQTTKRYVADLLLAPIARGEQIHVIIDDLCHQGGEESLEDLCRMMHSVGQHLAAFHSIYVDEEDGGPTHHGDLHSSNVFYSVEDDSIVFIDLANMGRPDKRDDLELFENSLAKNGSLQHKGWFEQVHHNFIQGYYGEDD